MAKTSQCLGIDIGSHTIRIAELVLGSGRIEIRNLVEEPVDVDPAQTPAEKHSAIAAQINNLIKTNKLKSRNAVFCVPGQTVFVRQLKVPATTPDRLHRIIQFEAREQIPFPLDKTSLEYQIFETDNPNEVEVLLVAIRRDHIDNFMKLVRKTGLKPLAISVSSLALHNFHEVNHGPANLFQRTLGGLKAKDGEAKPAAGGLGKLFARKGAKKKDEDEADVEGAGPQFEEIQAEVNLGATIMDLAIPKAGINRLIGFTRSVPRAGGQIDQAIRAKLGLESLEEATAIKENETAVLSSEFELSGDADSVNMAASEAATAVIDQIASEIRRSLDFFIAQPDGVAVDSIVLSGGLARLRFLDSYIEEKLGLPVEKAAIKSDKIEIRDDLHELVPDFVIPIGLAFQGLGLAQVSVDFLPQDIKDVRQFASNRLQIGISSALVIACIAVGVNAGKHYTEQNRRYIEEVEKLILDNQKDSETLKKTDEQNDQIATRYVGFARIAGHPFSWFDFYLLMLKTRPPEILIDRIELLANGIVRLQGVTTRKSSIPDFRAGLAAETALIGRVTIDNLPDPGPDPRIGPTRVQPFQMTIETKSRLGRFRHIFNPPEASGPGGALNPGQAAAGARSAVSKVVNKASEAVERARRAMNASAPGGAPPAGEELDVGGAKPKGGGALGSR